MRKTIGKLFLILMLLVIYAPILILAVYSFTDSGNIGSIHGFSMQNYVTLFTKGELRDMIVGTVLSGTCFISACYNPWNNGCDWRVLFEETCEELY